MDLPLLENFEFWTPANVVIQGIEKHLVFSSRYGVLYEGDCLNILPYINDDSIDTIFADPPFNLAKEYGSQVDDRRSDDDYILVQKMVGSLRTDLETRRGAVRL